MRETLRIGELAALVGVTTKTVRHYHAAGLLDEPPRSAGGYRLYGVDALLRLRRIRRLQSLGLTLAQVGAVLDEPRPEASLRAALRAMDAEVAAQIASLEERRARIAVLLADGDRDGDRHGDSDELGVAAVVAGVDHDGGMPSTLVRLRERLAGQVDGVSDAVWALEARFCTVLDGFAWPEEYGRALDAVTDWAAGHPGAYGAGLAWAERFAALAAVAEDDPEVVACAEAFVALQDAHPELLDATVRAGADASGVAEPHAAVLADLFDREVADRIAPAQRRCLELLTRRLDPDAAHGATAGVPR